jgi:hypothetical protein
VFNQSSYREQEKVITVITFLASYSVLKLPESMKNNLGSISLLVAFSGLVFFLLLRLDILMHPGWKIVTAGLKRQPLVDLLTGLR